MRLYLCDCDFVEGLIVSCSTKSKDSKMSFRFSRSIWEKMVLFYITKVNVYLLVTCNGVDVFCCC